jgi:hypothetical protein
MHAAMSLRPAVPLAGLLALALAFVVSQTAFSASASEAPELRLAAAMTAPAADGVNVTPPPRPPGHGLARVTAPIALKERPGGPTAVSVGATTEFGSERVMSVAARRGNWLGVVTPERPNGQLAWVRRGAEGLRLSRTRWSLHADLSERTVTLRRGGQSVHRLSVAIGGPGSPTPTGRFAVTDKMSGDRYGPYYGCCILALSGHQPNTPAGWQGGNRLAIHGTDAPGTIGAAASAGCLRAADDDLRILMSKVPVGTPVFVRR